MEPVCFCGAGSRDVTAGAIGVRAADAADIEDASERAAGMGVCAAGIELRVAGIERRAAGGMGVCAGGGGDVGRASAVAALNCALS